MSPPEQHDAHCLLQDHAQSVAIAPYDGPR